MARFVRVIVALVLVVAACGTERAAVVEPTTSPENEATAEPLPSPEPTQSVEPTVTPTAEPAPTDVAEPTMAPTPSREPMALGEGWVEVQGERHARSITEAEFGLAAVGWVCRDDWPRCPAAAWVSTNGHDWIETQAEQDGLGDVTLGAVAAFGSGVVAVGGSCLDLPPERSDCGPAVWTSDDGLAWTRVAEGVFPDCSSVVAEPDCNMFFYDVVTNGEVLVAYGEDVTDDGQRTIGAWVSTDGSSWDRALDNNAKDTRLGFTTALPTDDGFVAVGSRWETDGENWFERFVAWASTDGATWDEIAQPAATVSDDEDAWVATAAGWDGGITALGGVCDLAYTDCYQIIWHSDDGIEWERTSLGPELADLSIHRAFGIDNALVWSASTLDPGGDTERQVLVTTTDRHSWVIHELEPVLARSGVIDDMIEYDDLLVALGGPTGIAVKDR